MDSVPSRGFKAGRSVIEKTISVPQAAALMGISRSQAWRRLVTINRKYPNLRLLQRAAFDGTSGKYRVLTSAFRRILLDEESMTLAEVSERVGFIEADVRSLQARVGRLENSRYQQKICRIP